MFIILCLSILLWVGIKCFQPIFVVFHTVSDRCAVGDIHVENEDVSLNCHLYIPYLLFGPLFLVKLSWLLIGQFFSNTFLASDWSVIFSSTFLFSDWSVKTSFYFCTQA